MAIKGKNMVDLKQGNRSAILTLLHEQGGMSRKQIAAKLNLTPAAITMIVSEMIEDKIIRDVMLLAGSGSAGRKEIMIDICADRFFAMGVYYGVERAIISVCDLKGSLLSSETFLYDYENGADFIISKICPILRETIRQYEQKGRACVGIGVSARGMVDDNGGICRDSYGGWPDKQVPILKIMREKLGTEKICFKQNVRALADAYIFVSHGEVIESMLFVKNDVGIGSALVINHRIYAGYSCNAAEMGHIVVDRHGKACRCGGIGCLETIASCHHIEGNIGEIYSEQNTPCLYRLTHGHADNISFELAMEALCEDVSVKKIIDRAIEKFAEILRNNIIVLDTQKLVLHGRVFHSEYFLTNLIKEINYDNRYDNLECMLAITDDDSDLDAICSPISAIKIFFGSGGSL